MLCPAEISNWLLNISINLLVNQILLLRANFSNISAEKCRVVTGQY